MLIESVQLKKQKSWKYNKMNAVGRRFEVVKNELITANCQYTVKNTLPTRDFFKVDEDNLYVVRQKECEDGSWHFIVAAKMRKEVS